MGGVLAGGIGIRAAVTGWCCASIAATAAATAPRAERTIAWNALANGDFEERGGVGSPAAIPWWRSTRGAAQLEAAAELGRVLVTEPGEHAEQPFAAYAPLARELVVDGRVRGAGLVTIVDGAGAAARFALGAADGAWHDFAITGVQLEAALGRAPLPRFTLRLESGPDGAARWDGLRARVALPCPDEAALRDEVAGVLAGIFADWEQRALDDFGPRRTAFVARAFDVETGAELARLDAAPPFFPLQENLLEAVRVRPTPHWRAFLERYLEDLLSLALHPETGLPCLWDPARDERVDDRPVEIALPLGLLIDVARDGPEAFRDRARAAATRIGQAVMAHGLRPDGEVAASYVPRTGRRNPDVSRLRRLDVPAQLARLAALNGEPRFAAPAREALAALEYAHHWGGAWDSIDPAFDDDFGHYGARAATIALALPEEQGFRRFALEGMRHFLPLWRDATRFGGNLAADQVRCWRIAADLVRLDPDLRGELVPAVAAAVFAHVQGEQYGNGAWGDVTIFAQDPRTALQVGDMPGTPQNLLNGLAAVYAADHLGQRTETTRALFTAVLRSTISEYGRPHGFLLGRSAHPGGGNHAAGSLRVLLGLTTMLGAL
ncbi:MAG: hypothetical protein JNK02_02205 [Planctomycetes bacterium]|nr:hypothetical protein [Planctomycetota bacterium]